jgi:anti-sigma factor RsiW
MVNVPPTHATEAEIEQFHRRQLPGDALLALTDHLAGCDECRRRVAERGGAQLAALSAQNPNSEVADKLLKEIRGFRP